MTKLASIKGREVWVVNVLFIDNSNKETSTNSLVYSSESDAIEYADTEIDDYAFTCEMDVTERSPHLYKATNVDNEWYVTITIEQQMIL